MTEENIKNNNKIVNTMVAQLGGDSFFTMTGAKAQYKQVKIKNPLICFKLKKNKSKANYMKLSYIIDKDLYNIEFVKANSKEIVEISLFEDIYSDQLQNCFTEVTGMFTKL